MKHILADLYSYKTLSKSRAKETLLRISEGEFNNSQIASFLTAFNMRQITVEELQGFREALLEKCISINLSEFSTIDLCGTGGDEKNTFNISTLAAFIAAGAGIKVAKHGNSGVSSGCGSSDVLQYLGCHFTNEEAKLKQQIEESNFCYLHAPLFHPAMKNVAPVRKEMKVKTIFNILGPLVNPSNPKGQSVGVFNLELARLYQYMFQQSSQKYAVYHSLDGYDEISLTSSFKYISSTQDEIISPEQLNFPTIKQEEIYGGETVEDSAKIFISILKQKGSEAQNNVVISNAAAAIHCADKDLSLIEALSVAKESLLSGKALNSFMKYRDLTQQEGEKCPEYLKKLFM